MLRNVKPQKRNLTILLYLIAVLCILLSFIGYWLINENEKEHFRFEFEKEVEPIVASMQYSLDEIVADVDQIVRFFESSKDVTRAQFRTFTERLIARKKSIQALEWVPLVKHTERELYKTSAQKDGLDGFQFTEVSNGKRVLVSTRNSYYPVYYLEPYQRNESATGFDLGSDSTRLKALIRSRDSGIPAATSRIHLIQESEKQYGLLVLAPVYVKGKPISTVDERRLNIKGFAGGVFRVGNLVNAVLGQHGKRKLDVQLLDLSAPKGKRVLFISDISDSPVFYSIEKTFDFAGRIFSVKCSVTEKDYNDYYSDFRSSRLALGIGLIITILVVLLLNKYFNKIESERLENLNELYEQQMAIMASMPALVYMKDSSLKYVVANEAFYKLLNTNSEKIVGKCDLDLFPEEEADDFCHDDQSILKSGKPLINHEEYLTTKEGQKLFVLTTKIPIHNIEGSIIGIVGTTLDITDRKNAEKVLKKQSEDLERSNVELESFAYIASHDLKAPLRAIDNLSSWIEEDIRDFVKDDTKEYMTTLRSRVVRMENLLNSLLEYSRVGRVKTETVEVDLNIFIDDIITMINPPKSVSFTVPEGKLSFNTFKTPLQQIFMNLIGNAVKHRNKQSINIDISFEELDEFYKFTVADNGPGISKEFQEKAFQLFQTLKSRDEVEGSGMGLAIVKKTVENHGGTIFLVSDKDLGASFTFTWLKDIKER